MKISFLGAGNLTGTIVDALVNKLNFKGGDIAIFDKIKAQYDRYTYGGIVKAGELKEAVEHAEVLFLGVKPQNFSELLTWIKELNMDLTDKIFVSVAAGIPIGYIKEQLGQDTAIIRTMPNTSVMIGESMTAMCANEFVTEEAFAKIRSIFDNIGKTVILGEEKMNKIIAVNGSSPAYVYLLAEAMIDGAVAQGFKREEVYEAVIQSLYGAAAMMKTSGKQPEELLKTVASPNGTTEKALNSLNKDGFSEIIKKAMGECTARADELTRLYADGGQK